MQLQTYIEWRRMERTLLREAFGDVETVDAVHPIEVLGHRPGLVSLEPSDEMPGELAALQRLDLRQAFLQEILAEILDAGVRRALDCCGALTLRNGQKRDGIDTPGVCAAGVCDTSLSGGDALRAILRTG